MKLFLIILWLSGTLHVSVEEINKSKITFLPSVKYIHKVCPLPPCSDFSPVTWNGKELFVSEDIRQTWESNPKIAYMVIHGLVHDVRFRTVYNGNRYAYVSNIDWEEYVTEGILEQFSDWMLTRVSS